VKHVATASFWKAYEALPGDIRELADKSYALLKANPRHPSLQFKKIGELWSVRVTLNYRALALEHEGGFAWIWIGRHEDYERMIDKGKGR
jgi:hypothetical protein